MWRRPALPLPPLLAEQPLVPLLLPLAGESEGEESEEREEKEALVAMSTIRFPPSAARRAAATAPAIVLLLLLLLPPPAPGCGSSGKSTLERRLQE